jgi:hypothetical protein
VTLLEAVYGHPVWTAVLLLVAGAALAMVVEAAVKPFAPCRRGNCPRCNGTGAEGRFRDGLH